MKETEPHFIAHVPVPSQKEVWRGSLSQCLVVIITVSTGNSVNSAHAETL